MCDVSFVFCLYFDRVVFFLTFFIFFIFFIFFAGGASKEDDGVYMRYDRQYLKAFRQQFKQGSRRPY